MSGPSSRSRSRAVLASDPQRSRQVHPWVAIVKETPAAACRGERMSKNPGATAPGCAAAGFPMPWRCSPGWQLAMSGGLLVACQSPAHRSRRWAAALPPRTNAGKVVLARGGVTWARGRNSLTNGNHARIWPHVAAVAGRRGGALRRRTLACASRRRAATPDAQQIRGSCSPTSMSTIRSLPTSVRIVTIAG